MWSTGALNKLYLTFSESLKFQSKNIVTRVVSSYKQPCTRTSVNRHLPTLKNHIKIIKFPKVMIGLLTLIYFTTEALSNL